MTSKLKTFLVFLVLLTAMGMQVSPNLGDDTETQETDTPNTSNPEDNIGGKEKSMPLLTNLRNDSGNQEIVFPSSSNIDNETGNHGTGMSMYQYGDEDSEDVDKLMPSGNEPETGPTPYDDQSGKFNEFGGKVSFSFIESLMSRTNMDPLDLAIFYQCSRTACRGKCHTPVEAGTNCRCDERCIIFGDCCFDYFTGCRGLQLIDLLNSTKTKTDVTDIVKRMVGDQGHTDVHTAMYLYRKCESIIKKTYWMLSSCPAESDEQLQAKCNDTLSEPSAGVPVSLTSHPDLAFRNIFCALCNGVKKEEVMFWPTSAVCSGIEHDATYKDFMSKFKSSQCHLESKAPSETRDCITLSDNIHHCPIDEAKIDPKSLSCRSYLYHVYRENDEHFPNWHCGSCDYKGPFRNTSFVCEIKPDTFHFNELEMTLCEGRSCEGRCGSLSEFDWSCNCDSDCLLYGDCCHDFVPVCLNQSYTLNDLVGNELLIDTLTNYTIAEYEPHENDTGNYDDFEMSEVDLEWNYENLNLKLLYVNYRICHVLPDDEMIWAIGYCPNDDETLSCYQADPTNRSLIAPVALRGHPNIVFKNIYCALCHGIKPETLITWQTYISCRRPVSYFESEASLLRSKICSLNVYLQKGTRQCYKFDLEENQKSNQISPELCQAYRYSVYRGDIILRNPHCQQNVTQLSWPTCSAVYGKHGPSFDEENESRPSGLSILFNFKDDGLSFTSSGKELPSTVMCKEDEVYDDRNDICKRLHCQNGRIPINGTCVSNGTWLATEKNMIFPNGSRLYVVETYLMADKLMKVSDPEISEVMQRSEFYFTFERIGILPVSSIPPYLEDNHRHHYNITQVMTIVLAINSGNIEEHLMVISEVKSIFLVPNGNQIIGVSLKNYIDNNDFKCSFGAASELDNPIISELDEILYANETDKLYPLNNIPFILDISNSVPLIHQAWVCEFPLDCDPVAYNLTDFNLEDGDLQSKNSDLILSNGTYFISEELVYFCHNFTRGPFRRVQSFFQFDPVQDILSYISSAISLTSLAATLFVYILLPQIRNLPGRLTMSLSVSLFLAQGLLLFIHIPKGIFCKALAISLHYLWLCTFMWMTAMSINVARTFTNQLKGSFESIAAAHFKYGIFAFGIPAIIVLLSTLIEYLDIGDVEIGYGKHDHCWIANPRASLLTFGVPLAVMLLVNLGTFILTFYNLERTMRSTQDISSTQKDRNKVLIYCKLFVMMGLSWGFSFAAAFADIAVLWYMFILLNGLQGFYIFISFICTDRVKALLKKELTATHSSQFSQSKTQSNSFSKM